MMMNQRRKLALDELRKAYLKWVDEPDGWSVLYPVLKEVLVDDKHRVFLAGDPAAVDPTEMVDDLVLLTNHPAPSTSGRGLSGTQEVVYIPKTVAFALFNAGFQAGDSVQAKLLPNFRDGEPNTEMPWFVAEVEL